MSTAGWRRFLMQPSSNENAKEREGNIRFLQEFIQVKQKYEHTFDFMRWPFFGKIEEGPNAAVRKLITDTEESLKAYQKAFYDYMRTDSSESEADLEKAAKQLVQYRENMVGELSKQTNEPENKSEREGQKCEGTPESKKEGNWVFWAVLPEEFKDRENIDISIRFISKDCKRKDYLPLFRHPLEKGLYSGQAAQCKEKSYYAYVISYGRWSAFEWMEQKIWRSVGDFGQDKLYTDKHDMEKSEKEKLNKSMLDKEKSTHFFDGVVLCQPISSQVHERIRGMIRMLPNCTDEKILDGKPDVIKWISIASQRQLQLLEDQHLTALHYSFPKAMTEYYDKSKNKRQKYLKEHGLAFPFKVVSMNGFTDTCVEDFKVTNALKLLKPHFSKDSYLQLTYLALLTKDELIKLLQEECDLLLADMVMATVVYRCRLEKYAGVQDLLKACFNFMSQRFIENLEERELLLKLACTMISSEYLNREICGDVIDIILLLMDHETIMNSEEFSYSNRMHPLRQLLRLGKTSFYFTGYPKYKGGITADITINEIKDWLKLFPEKTGKRQKKSKIRRWWNKNVMRSLRLRCMKVALKNLLNTVFDCKEVATDSPMGRLIKSVAICRMFESEKEGLQECIPNVFKLINFTFEKTPDENLIKLMLKWKHFQSLLKFCNLHRNDMTSNTWNKLQLCQSVVLKKVDELGNGSITISLFRNICNQQDRFFKLCKLFASEEISEDHLRQTVNRREEERKRFLEFASKLHHFWQFHKNFKILGTISDCKKLGRSSSEQVPLKASEVPEIVGDTLGITKQESILGSVISSDESIQKQSASDGSTGEMKGQRSHIPSEKVTASPTTSQARQPQPSSSS